MDIELKLATEKDAAEWDGLVEKSPYGTLFHKWGWLKLAEKYSSTKILRAKVGCKLFPLMGFSGGELVGILPLFRCKRSVYDIIVSPPSRVDIPYLGPIINDSAMKQSKRETLHSNFLKSANQFISENFKPLYTMMSSSPGLFDSRPFSWQGYSITPDYTYELSLAPTIEAIRDNFHRDVRKKMNSAKAEGVEVRIGLEGADLLYELMSQRRQEQGGASMLSEMSPKKYILEVCSTFSPTYLRIVSAHSGGRLIGGMIALNHKKKVQTWFGNPKSQIDGVNELLIWELMTWAKGNGFESLELIGADADYPQLCQFKSRFNPQVVPHFTAKRYGSKVLAMVAHSRKL